MGKKAIRKRIESLLKRVREHELKIQNEKMKEPPDYGLIHHWEAEIAAFRVSIGRAEKRLKS
ncbi:hypothetical protein [Desulfonema magnum]|uniref:Uncharacterized protein n=1 Tax=Desulfonema magnum TaxID=45655 RepID=A0A975GNE2_9BACT|nr:hypothetical protein [Desulfonema magnum]QTA87866.1 Uncharacterized protein dnm_039060 [Desulfonema magnum]